jgi:ABC-type nitrate/sulfonate/bicarbonate transport system ATPase subunit
MICFEDVTINLDAEGTRHLYIDATFRKGDFVLVVGPNGSGKTSLLDLIAGVRQQCRGDVKGIPANSAIAYAVQDPQSSLLPWNSVISNILLPSRLTHSTDGLHTKALALLDSFGLLGRASDFPYRLSGGEKQIVNFIRTICTPAEIRLFDEVTASLHSKFKHVARHVLSENSLSTVTFFVSHDISDMVLPFTRFLALQESKVSEVTEDEAEEMMSHV